MDIDETTLSRINQDLEQFIDWISRYAHGLALVNCRLIPQVSRDRLADVHHFWTEDIRRLKEFSLAGKDPDHFKQAAHLAYWLRRIGPVMDYVVANYGPLNEREKRSRDFLRQFNTEYIAFDVGYQICEFYETAALPSGVVPRKFGIDDEYLASICCFLKEKNVSPHALYLIYKSLFYKRFAD